MYYFTQTSDKWEEQDGQGSSPKHSINDAEIPIRSRDCARHRINEQCSYTTIFKKINSGQNDQTVVGMVIGLVDYWAKGSWCQNVSDHPIIVWANSVWKIMKWKTYYCFLHSFLASATRHVWIWYCKEVSHTAATTQDAVCRGWYRLTTGEHREECAGSCPTVFCAITCTSASNFRFDGSMTPWYFFYC